MRRFLAAIAVGFAWGVTAGGLLAIAVIWPLSADRVLSASADWGALRVTLEVSEGVAALQSRAEGSYGRLVLTRERAAGFAFHSARQRGTSKLVFLRLGIPCWALALLLAAVPAWRLVTRGRRRRAARRAAGLCPGCGYDWSEATQGCPECGEPPLAEGAPRCAGG